MFSCTIEIRAVAQILQNGSFQPMVTSPWKPDVRAPGGMDPPGARGAHRSQLGVSPHDDRREAEGVFDPQLDDVSSIDAQRGRDVGIRAADREHEQLDRHAHGGHRRQGQAGVPRPRDDAQRRHGSVTHQIEVRVQPIRAADLHPSAIVLLGLIRLRHLLGHETGRTRQSQQGGDRERPKRASVRHHDSPFLVTAAGDSLRRSTRNRSRASSWSGTGRAAGAPEKPQEIRAIRTLHPDARETLRWTISTTLVDMTP